MALPIAALLWSLFTSSYHEDYYIQCIMHAKKICERKDTRLRLRLCIRIRAGWKEAQQEECLENASGAGHCSSVLPLSAFGQDISHLILDDLVVSSVLHPS